MTALYKAEGLEFRYSLGKQAVPALNGIDLEIRTGSVYCLTGPSGSGKTTLLNLLGLIEFVQKGSLAFEGREVAKLREREKNKIRRFRIGFIFQRFNLFPVLSADENVEYFLYRQGVPGPERRERVKEALSHVGLWAHRSKRPFEMSGGQRQRVAIARALAKKPEVIIGDEPTASLDQKTGREIMETLRELNGRYGVTLILASHDPMVHAYASNRVRLVDGRIAGDER